MAAEAAVIIGSGSIGVAIGRIAGIGRSVLLADYNEETINAVAEQLRGEGYDVTTHPIDISNHDAVAALADTAASLGNVTRVVLAAGVSPVQATTERVLHVDLLGTAYVLEEFGRVIAPGGSGIVISSMAGHMGEGYPREVEHALAYTPRQNFWTCPFSQPRKWATPALPTPWPSVATPCASRQQPSSGVRAGHASTP
jgi:NAD(P)-dependent dehydrogenase (short-subunit alcohol dehydrogenase family)